MSEDSLLYPRLNMKAQAPNQNIAIRCNDWHFLETNVFGLNNLTAGFENYQYVRRLVEQENKTLTFSTVFLC